MLLAECRGQTQKESESLGYISLCGLYMGSLGVGVAAAAAGGGGGCGTDRGGDAKPPSLTKAELQEAGLEEDIRSLALELEL